jgi:hypothetical protein
MAEQLCIFKVLIRLFIEGAIKGGCLHGHMIFFVDCQYVQIFEE